MSDEKGATFPVPIHDAALLARRRCTEVAAMSVYFMEQALPWASVIWGVGKMRQTK